jgi:adenylate cyclase
MPAETADRPVERKLAAIFAADIAGYSRLMGADEAGTFARLKSCRDLIDRLIAEHRGRIFNTAGDSIVADFASALDAASCAVAVHAAVAHAFLGMSLALQEAHQEGLDAPPTHCG